MAERAMIAAERSDEAPKQPGAGFSAADDPAPTADGTKTSSQQIHQPTERKSMPNARSPKAPKPSSSKRSAAAFSTQKRSARSSSTPRASLSHDRGDTTAKRARRSESQPRSSQSHFLQGINVGDCFDVRSIPDPPSPIVHRNRRRQSTPILMSLGAPGKRLEDVTNQGQDVDEGSTTTAKKSSNKKRKSLCHVPSSRTARDNLNTSSASRPDAEAREDIAADASQPESQVQESVEICLADDDEDVEISRASRKRRKKRQSIVVPTQFELGTSASSSSSSVDTQPSDKVSSPSSLKKDKFPGTKQSMEELRALVRGYCSGSHEEQKSTSDAIKQMTDYVMPGSIIASNIMEGDQGRSDKEILANRRSVFLKISPAMMEMEKQKQIDIKQWEDDTGCRVEKSNKSGKYKYYTIDNRERVGSQEYKRRYMTILEHYRPRRATKAQEWMDRLWESETVAATAKQSSLGFEPSSEEMRPVVAYPDGWEEKRAVEQEQQQRDAFLPPMDGLERSKSCGSRDEANCDGDAMDICDLSVSLDHGDQETIAFSIDSQTLVLNKHESESAGAAEIVEVSSEDTTDTDARTSTPSPLPLDAEHSLMGKDSAEDQVPGPVLVAQSRDEATEESNLHTPSTKRTTEASCETPLLPFPDRDRESSDPNIAQAERNLWNKIDTALQEYSEEIFLIMKAKESGSGGSADAAVGPS